MKKIFILFALALASTVAFAQARIEAGYLSSEFKQKNVDFDNMNGFKVGAYYGISLPLLPIVIEPGVTYAMSFCTTDLPGAEQKSKYAFVSVPVNVGFELGLGDIVAVRPYMGISAKYNTLGKNEYSAKALDVIEVYTDNNWLKENGHKYQIGGQVGLLVKALSFTASYQFQGDWTSAVDKGDRVSFPNHTIAVGYCF